MLNQYRKITIPAFILFASLSAEAKAQMECNLPISPFCNHVYIGAFGGGGASNEPSLTQKGIAFFPPIQGGPLDIHGHGDSNDNNAAGIVGMHAGYEWDGLLSANRSGWNIIPAAELEAYYLGVTQRGTLLNPSVRLPEHDFHDSFPMDTGVFLANSVWTITFPTFDWINFYAGAGIGASIVSISGANSPQVSPPEPGVNHFNSNTQDSDWAFAAQAKAGFHIVLNSNWRLFAEYRFLYVSSTNYTFGSTKYPTHVPTTQFNVDIGSMNYNMGAAGVEYSF